MSTPELKTHKGLTMPTIPCSTLEFPALFPCSSFTCVISWSETISRIVTKKLHRVPLSPACRTSNCIAAFTEKWEDNSIFANRLTNNDLKGFARTQSLYLLLCCKKTFIWQTVISQVASSKYARECRPFYQFPSLFNKVRPVRLRFKVRMGNQFFLFYVFPLVSCVSDTWFSCHVLSCRFKNLHWFIKYSPISRIESERDNANKFKYVFCLLEYARQKSAESLLWQGIKKSCYLFWQWSIKQCFCCTL